MDPLTTTPTSASSSSSSSSNTTLLPALPPSLIPATWHTTVRRVPLSTVPAAALSLAHAFATDPYARYLVDHDHTPESESLWSLHLALTTSFVAAHCLSGLATTIGPASDCVALWLPPGSSLSSPLTLLRSGLWTARFRLSGEGRRRYFDEIGPLLRATKKEVLGGREGEAWYLVYLGTRPESRGRGYAGRLVGEVVRLADRAGQPIYLESSSRANDAYYAQFGFEIKKEIFLTRGREPVRLAVMVREPGAGEGRRGVGDEKEGAE
ncbi:hypothetical protein B0T18DRAFT_425849 [Schizothecium vesticola]|uniref:N-acetyltransferase domain-containing protein n=1 Tax=Schizothecium vesticola TaxID=314040 RepID=A0AA40F4R0_9PEZI|nr:hypothetical protein B0T18DRAFT_425849 [Schizothecium vesticola]